MKTVVLLDNHDSFTWNLADLLVTAAATLNLPLQLEVVRNSDVAIRELRQNPPHALVLSPGPNAPTDAGQLVPMLQKLLGKLPILGVCLGHQAIAQALGGEIVRAPEPVHGRPSPILHTRQGLFAQLPLPFPAMRYHSLVVDPQTLPTDLQVTAWLEDGMIMALSSPKLRCESVQFHPESVETPAGMLWAQAAMTWLLQE